MPTISNGFFLKLSQISLCNRNKNLSLLSLKLFPLLSFHPIWPPKKIAHSSVAMAAQIQLTHQYHGCPIQLTHPLFSFTFSPLWLPKNDSFSGWPEKKNNNNNKTKHFWGGLQICPSSVEFTSARNMNTRVKRKCEKWVEWSELYRITKKDPQKVHK